MSCCHLSQQPIQNSSPHRIPPPSASLFNLQRRVAGLPTRITSFPHLLLRQLCLSIFRVRRREHQTFRHTIYQLTPPPPPLLLSRSSSWLLCTLARYFIFIRVRSTPTTARRCCIIGNAVRQNPVFVLLESVTVDNAGTFVTCRP